MTSSTGEPVKDVEAEAESTEPELYLFDVNPL